MSFLDTIREHGSVEDAAEECAGNYRNWSCFMWLGENDFDQPERIMLGYLVNNCDPALRDMANMAYIKAQLAEYWGMAEDPTKTCDDYGASVSGQADMLGGMMIRVYDANGEITPAFRRLYQLVEDEYSLDGPMDEETADEVNRCEMRKYLHGYLEYECRKRSVPFNAEFVENVMETLIGEDIDYDTVGDDELIDRVAFEEVAS